MTNFRTHLLFEMQQNNIIVQCNEFTIFRLAFFMAALWPTISNEKREYTKLLKKALQVNTGDSSKMFKNDDDDDEEDEERNDEVGRREWRRNRQWERRQRLN